MAGGIDVNIGADTREFDRGVRSGMIDPVEDAQKALDDYVKAGDDAGSKLESTFRDQQRQTVDLRGDIDRLNRTIANDSGPAYRKMSANATEASHRTQEGFDEIKDSARSNAIETAASFDGSFSSITGGVQGLLSEFLAGFGPAGIIAGLVAASGLGLLTTSIEGGTEAAEAQKQAVSDLGAEYIAAGRTGRREFDAVAASITAMATSTGDDVAITLQKAYDAAKKSGADYQEVVESIAQATPGQLDQVIAKVKLLQQGHLDDAAAAQLQGRFTETAMNDGSGAAGILITALEKTRDTSEQAARAQRLAAKAGLSDFQLKADLLHQVEDAFDDAATGSNHFNKKTGEFDVSGFLKEMRKVKKSLQDYRDDLAEADLPAAAKKFLESQGAETAAAMLRGYQKASPGQKRELGEIWRAAGVENASTYTDALGGKLNAKKVPAPKIERPVVPTPDSAALDRFLLQPRRLRVMLDVVDRKGQRVY